MRQLVMKLVNCRGCPFCREARYDMLAIPVCGNEEAQIRRGGNILLQLPSTKIPAWCPLPLAGAEGAEDATERVKNGNIIYGSGE